jgi:hypothetical protein
VHRHAHQQVDRRQREQRRRQPRPAISAADSGMNTLLASPPRKVRVMIARRKSCGNGA